MIFQIVVARYNEDIEYLSLYAPSCMIYNKGNEFIPIIFKNIINLPNIGREGHTYLYHIINNYNNLADNTLFIQGNISDHKMFNIIDYIKNNDIKGKISQIKIKKLTNKINFDKKYLNNLKKSNMTSFQFINNILNIKLDNIESIPIIWGANFCVSKSLILSKPIEYYQNLIKYLEYDNNPEEGHFFERSWYIIFKYPYLSKKINYYYIFNENNNFNNNDIFFNKLLQIKENIDIWSNKLFNDNIIKKYNLNVYYLNNNQICTIYPLLDFDKDNNIYSFEFNYSSECILLLNFENDIYELRLSNNNLIIYHHNTNLIIIDYNFEKLNNIKNKNKIFYKKLLIKWTYNKLLINNFIELPIFLKNLEIKFIKVVGKNCHIKYLNDINLNKNLSLYYYSDKSEINNYYLNNKYEYYTIPLNYNLII